MTTSAIYGDPMAVLLRKLLRIGALPADMRAEVDSEGLLHLAEYVPVTMRFTGQVPGRTSVGKLRGYVGALALTHKRVLATISTVPKKAGRTIDHEWSALPGTMVIATLSADGLLLDAPDLSVIDPAFSGSFSLTYKTPVPESVLQGLPTRSVVINVPPAYVYSALGLPAR